MNVTFSCPVTEAAQNHIKNAVQERNVTLTTLETTKTRVMYRLDVPSVKDAVAIADVFRVSGITDLYLLANRMYSELDAVQVNSRWRGPTTKKSNNRHDNERSHS